MKEHEAKRQLNLAEKFNSFKQALVLEAEVKNHENEIR